MKGPHPEPSTSIHRPDRALGGKLAHDQISVAGWHHVCWQTAMIDLALSVLALVAGGLTLELYAASSAQKGPQDDEARTRPDNCPSEHPA